MTHEYPPNRAFDSVTIRRVAALRDYGLTQRQREFLVTVMVHSGCFLERQYCEFTGTVRGQNSRDFMARLVARGFTRSIEPGHVRRGRLYHVHHKPLYGAIGRADDRNRRLHTIGRMVERVMILDAVMERPSPIAAAHRSRHRPSACCSATSFMQALWTCRSTVFAPSAVTSSR